eukprot:gnl/TRDRNA2_/TRDRNA2_81449_c1_seq1.p1 gnl/TRDRNA2_/TRDRNA2_81449_c1~~gnl/TRDRNA2_/TRDRNA2_81449_c1_seq1.p1  ORF type:complete len:208 (-),score=26.49 gnl/TRDRNA2_/TRDRNA2_81449_c1_seq1:113-736(-)
MKVIAMVSLLLTGTTAEFRQCGTATQARFDIMMCESYACNSCILSWCTELCQKVQLEFPSCRCKSWPLSRKSFSGGDFAGKGKFGDAGGYAGGDSRESERAGDYLPSITDTSLTPEQLQDVRTKFITADFAKTGFLMQTDLLRYIKEIGEGQQEKPFMDYIHSYTNGGKLDFPTAVKMTEDLVARTKPNTGTEASQLEITMRNKICQ